jgi:UDP-glucose:(heptosyl)LPS alpha-1,3-glucosyltransferase
MKIAVIRYKYVNYGGAEGFVDQYTNQLAKAGHEVHIFAHQWETGSPSNLHVHPVPAFKFNAFIRSLSFAWFAARAIRKENFDVVQSHERIFDQDIYRAGDGCHREWLEQRKKLLSPVKKFFLSLNPFHRLILFMEKRMFEKG